MLFSIFLKVFLCVSAFATEIPYEDYEGDEMTLNSTFSDEEDFIPSNLLLDANADSFNYVDGDANGPSNWWKFSPNCIGGGQSPINLDIGQTFLRRNSAIKMTYYKKAISSVQLTNNGHTLSMKFVFGDPGENSYVFNGETYILDSAHLHWGNPGTGGSEHTLNGQRFAAEIHFVHFNKKYGTLDVAATKPDGLSVIGIFLALSASTSPSNRIFPEINKVVNVGSTHSFATPNFTIKEFIRTEVKKFFSYKGSLTTPPCNPVVQWIVSKDFMRISALELEALRRLQAVNGPMTMNFRPLQSIGSRTININVKKIFFK